MTSSITRRRKPDQTVLAILICIVVATQALKRQGVHRGHPAGGPARPERRKEMDTMSATDRDKARALLRGWQAGINAAQSHASAAVPIAAVACTLLDLGDTIRAARTDRVARP